MTPKIMQCEYGENKGMFYCMRETGHEINSPLSGPVIEYLHPDKKWKSIAYYFYAKEVVDILTDNAD